ncbi:hypothetical protein EDB85DRAFT_2288949 [Lactarius pseudohatsudake]|nr:hypothetical protein EDB85DRAFT_2288949 [Lactarius pseudohatsudake]
MPFFGLLRKSSQPSLARPASADVASGPFSENPDKLLQRRRKTEPTPSFPRSWRRKAASSVGRAGSSPPIEPALPVTPKVESPAPDTTIREMPTPMPLPAGPDVFLNLTMLPSMEIIPTISPESDLLAATWDEVKDGPKGVSVDRSLDILGDAMTAAQSNAAPFTPLITAAASAVGQTEIGKVVKEGIDHFFDGMPVLMNALDELKALHPFVGVVVLAFTAVYTLEQKRRDNEKKVIALYVEMKDMMGVLLLLRNVQNDKLVAPDGRSIEDRLKTFVERTADDIKLCSNVCDTYAKKKLLAKVFLGPVWDDKLLSWVTLFSKRRQEFEFELSIHTSQGVDKANVKLDVIGDATRALDEKMDVLKAMFEQLVSPEQKQLAATVAASGGVKALRNNDKMLLELEKTASKAPSAPSAEGHRGPRAKANDVNPNADALRADVFEDPDAAVAMNQVVYFRKFEAQKRQIIDELTFVVKRESDRVIQEMKGGPHDRIRDRTIYDIWTEMGWRGNVKARHFVLALRDHYLEKLAMEADGVPGMGGGSNNGSRNPDAWAIKFVDVTRLQPISEAFDDDASGFITISEMNRFTGSRPADWSLPHWVAFWAVGYRASIIDYASKIEELLAKMEGIRAEVLPPNRRAFDDYFRFVWEAVHTLTAAVTPLQPELALSTSDRFKSHLEAEEARLSNNLKAVDYTIDGTDTLTLITGVGRIEKTVFPLIYLLLKRHYEIMRTMRTNVLDPRELGSGRDSIYNVNIVTYQRMNDLTNIFIQQKHNPEKQFQNFAYGIFKYLHSQNDFWSAEYVRNLDPRVIPYDDANEDKDVKLEEILKYEHKDELALDDWVYEGHSIDDTPNYSDVEPPLKDILGDWHGYFYEGDGIRETAGVDTMMTFVLEPADGEHELKADAWSNRGRYTITGSWSKGENDVMEVKLKMTYQSASWSVFFSGRFDAERDALTGVWGLSAGAENSNGLMEFRRIPPRYLTVYPSIKELSDNKSRALWGFAIAAVRNDVLRERWSWLYFAQRREDREAVISLGIRYLYFGKPLNSEEDQLFSAAKLRLTAADACFYTSIINRTLANTWVHVNAFCDWCGGRIGGARLLCLDCEYKNTDTFGALDLCCAKECMAARITHRQDLKVPHEPSHRLVKVRPVVHYRQHGRVHTAALAAFRRAQTLCTKIAESHQQLEEKDEKGEETDQNTKNASSPEYTPEEIPPGLGDGKPGDDSDVPGDTAVEVNGVGDTSQDPSGENSQGRTQPQESDLPSCGKCMGRLLFPCWYCTKCEDDLFLCDSCDREGVPELMRSSGKHTENHHLIRCLAPEKDDDTLSSTERRLISLEDQLNSMHSRFDNTQSRFDNMQSQFDNMQSRFDDLTQDLTSRIGNIEQLLHELAAAVTSGRSA